MPITIYKVTREGVGGGVGLRFEGRDGTRFVDANGLRNPQLARIVGNRLRAYVRCEVGNGLAEVVGEASAEEIAAYERPGGGGGGTMKAADEEKRDPEGPYRLFPR